MFAAVTLAPRRAAGTWWGPGVNVGLNDAETGFHMPSSKGLATHAYVTNDSGMFPHFAEVKTELPETSARQASG